MVSVIVATTGTYESVADALLAWSRQWPGDDQLVVDVRDRNWAHTGRGAVFPDHVSNTVDALGALASMIAEHAEAYDIQYQPEDGPGGYGIAKLGRRRPVALPVLGRKLLRAQGRFSDLVWKPRISIGILVLVYLLDHRVIPYLWSHRP